MTRGAAGEEAEAAVPDDGSEVGTASTRSPVAESAEDVDPGATGTAVAGIGGAEGTGTEPAESAEGAEGTGVEAAAGETAEEVGASAGVVP